MKSVLKEVKEKLLSVGIDDPSESEWLIAEAINKKRSDVFSLKELSNREYERVQLFLQNRMERKPLDYIIGKSQFFGLSFMVNENVLIPRPETELLVEEVLKVVKQNDEVLDIGTGSGVIAISVKVNSNVNMTAVDISNKALIVAQENAKNLAADIEFIQSDLFSAVPERKFDVIISNPPYIPTGDIKKLEREVREYEPILALDGGISGLDIYQRIIAELDRYLKVGGYVFFEVGINQADKIKDMFTENYIVEIKKDYNKIERIIIARRII